MKTQVALGCVVLWLSCSEPKPVITTNEQGGNGTTESGGTNNDGGTTSDAGSTNPTLSGGSVSAGGVGATAGETANTAGAGGNLGCESTRERLEAQMSAALAAAAIDPEVTAIPDFTLVLEAENGHRFVFSHGDSTTQTRYESASTSKWVAASVILELVDREVLALTDEPSRFLPFWKAPGVTLAQLLSFTSGFSREPLCFNLKRQDFAECVERAYELNVEAAPAPGSEFDYSSTHLQIAGLMAIRAAKAADWHELFEAWKLRTGLFQGALFDLPSLENPRLAGGMHWTAEEYLGFLRAIFDGQLLSSATRGAMLEDQRGEARVIGSPALDAFNQDWSYGFGNWLECRTALGANTFDCGSGHRNSSPGAYGAYPFIDFDHRYIGILARQGDLGTFREGDSLFGVISEQAAEWADACGD